VAEDDVLFSGDVVMNESFVAANQTSSITAWLAAFDTFGAMAVRAEGRSIDEAATTIQAELTAEHPTWPRANGLAALARSAWTEAR
jgi:hypothetical protein